MSEKEEKNPQQISHVMNSRERLQNRILNVRRMFRAVERGVEAVPRFPQHFWDGILGLLG